MKKKARMGRPPKPEGEKYVGILVRLHPDDLAELKATIPLEDRAEFMRSTIKEGVREWKENKR